LLLAPRELRETFELLRFLDNGLDLDGLLDRVDWHDVTPQQASYATLGRLPQDLHYSGLANTEFEPKAYFRTLLLCPEFQSGIVSNLLNAFPEKTRRFFVHVPRCGGTSLGETLAAHACTIPHNAVGLEWCSGHEFLHAIARICRDIQKYDAIHVSGHYTLRSIIENRSARFSDSIWTTIRAPHEIILSYINYILTVLKADPELIRPDTRQWAKLLDVDAAGIDTLAALPLGVLLPRMLRREGVLPNDLLCHFLGDGTAASALDLLAAADVEVIDAKRLDQWREQHWNIPPRPWANVSGQTFKWNNLDQGEKSQINALIRQDAPLYQTVSAALGGELSLRGMQIARSDLVIEPAASGSTPPARMRRASRPILLDPRFMRVPGSTPDNGPATPNRVGWADPPLRYQTIETTLRFPLIETRIRVRYARRYLAPRQALPRFLQQAPWRAGLSSLFGRLGTIFAR